MAPSLVDDTSVSYVVLTPQAQIAALRNALLPQQRRMSEGMEPPVEPGGTNPPPDLTPQLVPPELIPTNGTFSLLQQSNWPPFPYDPFPGADVYVLYDGSFIIDDTAVDYSSLNWSYDGGGSPIAPQGYPYASGLWIEILGISNAQTRLILHGTTAGTDYTLLSRDSLAPGQPWNAEQAVVGAGGQDWTPVQVPTFGRSHLFFWAQDGTVAPQTMWLQATGVTNGYLNLILHGTDADTVYELMSKSTLSAGEDWASEGSFTGATGQYWTAVTFPLSGRTSLFVTARSWVETYGLGIPDWWIEKWFHTNWVDPYSIPLDDGWTVLDKYSRGWNPLIANPPPAPTGLAARYYGPSTNVSVQWDPNPGATNYVVRRKIPALGRTDYFTNAAMTWLSDSLPANAIDSSPYGRPAPTYEVMAEHGGGASPWTEPVSILRADLLPNASIVRGPLGHLYLVTGHLPSSVVRVRIWAEPDDPGYGGPDRYPGTWEAN